MTEPPSTLSVNGVTYVRQDMVPAPKQPDAPEQVYTAAVVAKMSGVGVRTVYNLMDKGVIQYLVPNGCERPRLVKRSEYERWLGL